MAQALDRAGIAVAVVNPRRARDAKACGPLAKTDRMDAPALAPFAERFQPPPRAPRTAPYEAPAALVLRRRQLVTIRDGERSQGRRVREPERIKSLGTHLARLEAEMGPLTAASRLALMQELGRIDGKATASLASVTHSPATAA